MTPEKQRIKIAEACGWVLNPECDFLGKAFPQCWTHDDYNMVFHDYELPNYTDDLNALQDAERHFVGDASKAMAYAMHLLRACGLSIASEYDELNVDYCWHACHATAAQRAEAFLKTLNLWEE